MIDRIELANEITEFLEKHAKLSADYDPEFDEPCDRFNGPDSTMLNMSAEALRNDAEYARPNSDFKSGCYKPMTDENAKAWHDQIVTRLNDYLAKHSPKGNHRL